MTSLASKILFLNNPSNILPYDSNVKKALGINRLRSYQEFKNALDKHKRNFLNNSDFKKYYDSIGKYANITEKEYKLPKSKKIRENRFADLLLWTKGNSERKSKPL